MNKKLLLIFAILPLVVSCKFINTHVVKVINAPILAGSSSFLVKTTKGNVYLLSQGLSSEESNVLQTVKPAQCLAIITQESFSMVNREVHFKEFKLKKVLESESGCRNIRTPSGLKLQR